MSRIGKVPVTVPGGVTATANEGILSVKGGTGTSFFDHWLVPLSVAIVFVAGLLYLLILRPKENVREDARSGAPLATARP